MENVHGDLCLTLACVRFIVACICECRVGLGAGDEAWWAFADEAVQALACRMHCA